jgi:hypothetical protein
MGAPHNEANFGIGTLAGVVPDHAASHILSADHDAFIRTLTRMHASRRTNNARVTALMHECNNVVSLSSLALVFSSFASLICLQPAENAGLRGHMDDRIGRRAASGGVDRTAAEMAVAIIPQLLPNQGLSDEVRAVGARAPQRHLAMLPSPAPRLHGAGDRRACLGTRISADEPSAHRIRTFAHSSMRNASEMQGNMQPARTLARSPGSASPSGV